MMSDMRLVIVKSIQRFSPSDKKRLIGYVKNPLESTCLVLVASKADRRQSFYADLCKHSQWAESKSLYENQAEKWVEARMRSLGIRISREAVQEIVKRTGTSLWALHNEVEKCLTFGWGKTQLKLEDIYSVIGFSRQYNNWELTDCVGRRELHRAHTILTRLLEEGQSPVGLIVDLTQRIKLLLRVQSLRARGVSGREIARYLKLTPFFAKLYLDQADRYSLRELDRSLRLLLRADYYLKTGYMRPSIILSLAVHNIIRGTGGTRFFEYFWEEKG
jgi:DNA polymerase-3 subunit delta